MLLAVKIDFSHLFYILKKAAISLCNHFCFSNNSGEVLHLLFDLCECVCRRG